MSRLLSRTNEALRRNCQQEPNWNRLNNQNYNPNFVHQPQNTCQFEEDYSRFDRHNNQYYHNYDTHNNDDYDVRSSGFIPYIPKQRTFSYQQPRFMDQNNIPLQDLSYDGASHNGRNQRVPPNYENWQIPKENMPYDQIEEMPSQANNADKFMVKPNRIHSMHRNAKGKPHCNKVKLSYEAQTGGRNHIKGDVQNYDIEQHAEDIVSKMKEDQELMDNSPNSAELRKETLRHMPQSLKVKRRVKHKLTVSEHTTQKPISCGTALKYRLKFAFVKFKNDIKDLSYIFELWYKPLKEIEGHYGSGVASFFKFLRWIFVMNTLIMVPVLSFIVIPQLGYKTEIGIENKFEPLDLLSGEGYLEKSALFYGFYSNGSVSMSKLKYSMPDAYFFTNLIIYLLAMLLVCISAAKSYRKSFIETEGGLQNVFAQKVFCSWDFGIATKKAAQLKANAICNEIKELLSDSQKTEKKRSKLEKFYTLMVQVTTNILIAFLLAGTGYLIWFCLENDSIDAIATACVINMIMFVGPVLLNYIVKFEDYKDAKVTFYITLFRTFLLGFVVIGVFTAYWLIRQNSTESGAKSWEISLGQEMYRLILFDFVFSVVLSFLFDLIMFICKRPSEFDISRNTMQIIYNQSLFWMGLFYSPILPVIVLIKLFLIFYIRELTVKKFCKPSAKSWRAARNQTWFTIMVALGLMLICLVQGYIFVNVPPTKDLGPFRNYDYIYEFITIGVLNLQKGYKVWNYLLYITKPGTIALILIALSVFVYVLKEKANAQRIYVNKYREKLIWEAKDKEYLISEIDRITNGEWKYRLNEGRDFDPITMLPQNKQIRRQESDDYRRNLGKDGPSCSQNLLPQEQDFNFTMNLEDFSY